MRRQTTTRKRKRKVTSALAHQDASAATTSCANDISSSGVGVCGNAGGKSDIAVGHVVDETLVPPRELVVVDAHPDENRVVGTLTPNGVAVVNAFLLGVISSSTLLLAPLISIVHEYWPSMCTQCSTGRVDLEQLFAFRPLDGGTIVCADCRMVPCPTSEDLFTVGGHLGMSLKPNGALWFDLFLHYMVTETTGFPPFVDKLIQDYMPVWCASCRRYDPNRHTRTDIDYVLNCETHEIQQFDTLLCRACFY